MSAPQDHLHERLRQFWDDDAEIYDRSPTHAGTEPVEAAVWRAALVRHLPPPPASILDAGAGTGAMSLLLAEMGYQVMALDLSRSMLARAIEKAAARNLDVDTWVAPATQPPPGPFDAVVERHLLWTLPDPIQALRAWRSVAPRLVSYEGIFGSTSLAFRARRRAAGTLKRLLRVEHDHHAEYEADLLAALPLAGGMQPAALIGMLGEAGWTRFRFERLRDVEWARRLGATNPVLGYLESVPHFALLAER
jgi:ubiquinone/menaquinone biosynthesis C-methylase UbiE